ncbi:MAG: BamA/TamA family outer membrane protein [Polaromonas sp.]|uniref:autotransporter assembly complex protein TamA n=1 Tax=Polaromonas sp. TaxID=1869339 RepID=UPI0027359251|nr:BamA/TamA family outer membrane protein [Polaromonas sp.]MDP2820485.1 BamA/TamA family outer membrane protein [Polaromonas sp.]
MTHFRSCLARRAARNLPAAAVALLLACTAAAQAVAPAAPSAPSDSAVPPPSATQPAPNTQTSVPTPPPASVPTPDTPAGAIGPTQARPEVTAFDIEVKAPPEVRTLLERHLELQRYRAVTDLDDAELARLVVLAERNVRNLVGTLGYFSPTIRITREGAASQRPNIVVAVDPGDLTRTRAVAIAFSGDIAQSPDADALTQREGIRRNWRLPPGQRFTQDSWDGAKTQALRELVARRYPAGRLETSLADIDAPAASADLSLTLDSGPLYRLGPMQVSGIQRYDPQLVPRLARLDAGSVYDQNRLLEAQQRLASSGHFDSATILIDPDSDPQAAPVQVTVREAPLQKVILGVGITTDSGPRASVEHTHHRVPGIGWRAVTKLQLERKSPFAQTEWTDIPDNDGWRRGFLGRAERLDDNELVTRAQRLRFGRSQAGDRIDRNVYLQYDRASVQSLPGRSISASNSGDGSAISGNYVWTGRYFDSLPFPSRGYGLGAELGGGFTLGTDRKPFLRSAARWLGVQSLTRGRIAMRAEAAAVLAADSARIPGTLLFRTGGDSTVRGYGYRDIGILRANGVTGPGRYMAVGSMEWQRPMLKNGLPTEWENTFFIDAGSVAERPQDLKPKVGIGTGVRWRSPIGPLQIDLAYGVQPKKFRLHMSVGFVF